MYIKGRYMIIGLVTALVLSSGLTVVGLNASGHLVKSGDVASPAVKDAEFNKLVDTYTTLKNGYYQDVKDDTLLNGAIDGMVKSLDDPYSTYMSPTEAEDFHENISSSFEGIGAEIKEEDGKIVVDVPIKGAPAEKAGIKPNDRIVSVDGKSLNGLKVTEAVTYIRGKKGSKAELVIERPGETGQLNISVVRDTIPVETVKGEMLDDGMARITMSKFAETTADEFTKSLTDLKGKGMKGLILDMRQNPGGLLDVCVEIANQLIPDQKLILQVEDRSGQKEVYRSKHGKSDFPIVVLVDGGSASAAEILAGALKESGNYPLVGTKTFGKGTVQTTKSYDDGSNIKYTMAKWLTPDGNWIHKKGIEPDYKVDLPEYADLPYLDPEKEIKPDTFSNEVKTAQTMLEALGYQPGRKDGFFDDKTKQAVVAFQKVQNLDADGVIKGKTTSKMIELLQKKIQDNDTQLDKAKQVLRKMLP
ncbi:peptidoglycan-binding protein [Tumebacillus sp. ITR2]|uniref:Peptidoglycan-binding protein n=1 Tax=Tumebacillus amylolyticus TaxID=2801339 RepID=A0ABS1J9M8_9BACL|nr:S41 family peptidase [Tumebacillus amylolyticus]MBL0386978.1 peptidoglycan-binding protein [Tumebacillus amylolyticus]